MQGPGDHTNMLPTGAPTAATESKVHEGDGNGGGELIDQVGHDQDDKSNSGVVINHNHGHDGGGGGGANRWPRQETLALLKIRSDMDSVFRDSSLKAPLWEEVSRKLSELGFNRSAKKCKEKFENVYKYHRRTKDTKIGKSEGKTYKFFDQLQALENHSISQPPPPPAAAAAPPPPQPNSQAQFTTKANPPPNDMDSHATISSKTTSPIDVMPLNIFTPPNSIIHSYPLYQNNFQSHNAMTNRISNSTNSSSTASDEELEGSRKKRKKRKWKEFIKRATRDIIKKQEEMQRRFLETLDKQEQDRIVRVEAWRMQEIARLNREHEMLIQERSSTIAKDTGILTFLQKLSGHQNSTLNSPLPPPPPSLPPQRASTPASITKLDAPRKENNGDNVGNVSNSSSRWPKPEIEALIKLRTNLDLKYQDNSGSKGPLWEEISIEMQKLGYNRSAKRCKEKWENINKYFKKVKDNNKKIRSQDSKTCPYFHQLHALYKEKNKMGSDNSNKNVSTMEPLMAPQQQQQWSFNEQEKLKQQEIMIKTVEDKDHEDDDIGDEEEEEGYSEEEEEEEEGGSGGFEVVANKQGTLMES